MENEWNTAKRLHSECDQMVFTAVEKEKAERIKMEAERLASMQKRLGAFEDVS